MKNIESTNQIFNDKKEIEPTKELNSLFSNYNQYDTENNNNLNSEYNPNK